MENKNTVIDAKIGNLNELTKVLSVKEQAQEQLLVVIKALGIGKIVRNLKFEKAQGYSLTLKLRKEQFKEKRNAKNPDYARKAECDESKLEMAKRMLCHAVGHGINFKYMLADSWFTCESLIQAVRELCGGSVHYIGWAKMNPKLRYQTRKSKHPQNIHELIVRYERTASCYCRKYKCKYIRLHAKLGEQPIRIFIIKYGRSTHWKVLLTTDTSMNFVRAFELYERRWGIEVIFRECRGYLGLGKCQSRSYNAQIADTTLCFMMYQMLSLAKRFSEYETLGALFRSERDRLQVLTLWSRTLEEVRHLLEVLSREAGVDLLACLSTVAARQMADFSTKIWAHLLYDSDDYAMPDLA